MLCYHYLYEEILQISGRFSHCVAVAAMIKKGPTCIICLSNGPTIVLSTKAALCTSRIIRKNPRVMVMNSYETLMGYVGLELEHEMILRYNK